MKATTNNVAANIINLTSENFKINEVGIYSFDGKTIEVTNKITAFGSGKKTVYSGKVDKKEFTNIDICQLKKLVGIQVAGAAKGTTVRIMSDEEVAAMVEAEFNRAKKLYNNFANFVAKYNFNVGDMAEVEIKDAIECEISNKVAAAKAAKAEADKKRAEKEAAKALKDAKEADKVFAAKAVAANDIQRQIMEATINNDFAKVQELLQKLQEAA